MMIQWNWAVDSVIEVVKSQSLAAESTFVGPVGQTCQFTFQRISEVHHDMVAACCSISMSHCLL